MNAHVSILTLGARDVDRVRRFYGEGPGWLNQNERSNWVSFSAGAAPFAE